MRSKEKVRYRDKVIQLSRCRNLVIKREGKKTTFYKRHALVDHFLLDDLWNKGDSSVKLLDSHLLTANFEGKTLLTIFDNSIPQFYLYFIALKSVEYTHTP